MLKLRAILLVVPLCAASLAFAQAGGPAEFGHLAAAPRAPAGSPLPPAVSREFLAEFHAFRDLVYNSASRSDVAPAAAGIVATARSLPVGPVDLSLILSRIEFLDARSLKESGDKKNATLHYENALAHARASMAEGEHPAGLMALAMAVSELCLLKDMAFLVSNGPSVSKTARKALAIDPGNVRARVSLAAAKAYPPGIFGGSPPEAVAMMKALIRDKPEGFERDDLFDIRVCVATAYGKMGDARMRAEWFSMALELFPANAYAREEGGKTK